MPKNKAELITNYVFKPNEEVMLDANIWIYLYSPPSSSNTHFVNNYSSAFKSIVQSKTPIIINSLILSEYLNRYCRMQFDAMFSSKYKTFKTFRQSPDYLPIGKDAANYASSILSLCTLKDDNFTTCNLNDICNDFASGSIDFNDGLIADACKKNGWALVTNDGDFVMGDIKVITANNKLIQACK